MLYLKHDVESLLACLWAGWRTVYVKGSLIFHLHKCCDFCYDTFLIRWCESLQPPVWVIVCVVANVGVLPNFDLDRMDLFLRHPRTDSLTVSVRWCAETEQGYAAVLLEYRAEFSVLHQTHLGKSSFIAIWKCFLLNIKSMWSGGSKQFFLNAGQQNQWVWQLWKVFELPEVCFFHY